MESATDVRRVGVNRGLRSVQVSVIARVLDRNQFTLCDLGPSSVPGTAVSSNWRERVATAPRRCIYWSPAPEITFASLSNAFQKSMRFLLDV